MSLSINESVDTITRCKGNWLSVEHYIIPNIPMKKNEKYGYCKICWENDFKNVNPNVTSPDIHYTKSYKDSKINPTSGPCSNDTL